MNAVNELLSLRPQSVLVTFSLVLFSFHFVYYEDLDLNTREAVGGFVDLNIADIASIICMLVYAQT